MGALEALEPAFNDLFHPVLDVALVGLIELEVSVCILWLSRVASGVTPERCHLI